MLDLISAKNLTISYGKTPVISHADFSINQHDFICIVGANGSGKSTLIKAILGLIKPKVGSISYKNGLSRTAIGFLPQETRIDQHFPATVFEIVLSGTLGHQPIKFFYKKSQKEKAANSLKQLGITNLKNSSFTDLSGGEKQKVLLARALAATSDLLILDEPSNNLDHKSRKDFYRTLKNLHASGLTIIMITHDLDTDDLIGNKVLAIKDGHIKLVTTNDFLRSFK